MINNFIKDFKNSIYYKNIFTESASNSILGIYIVGSTCLGLNDDLSDYDLVILTVGGEHINTADELIIKYKGKKVHWWYFPVEDLFKLKAKDLRTLTPVQLYSFLDVKYLIYENKTYNSLLNLIYTYKQDISRLNWYKLYEDHKKVINNILACGSIEPRYYSYKYIYHLCVATYNLYNKPFDIEYLKEIKNMHCKTVNDDTKNKALQDIIAGVEYIKNNPINYKTELLKLSDKIFTSVNL